MNFEIKGGSENAKISVSKTSEKDGLIFFKVEMKSDKEQIPEGFSLKFKYPVCDCYSLWLPMGPSSVNLGVDWAKKAVSSRLASSMPIMTIVSSTGKNRLTVALSDAITPTRITSGVCEEDAYFDCEISFFTIPVAPLSSYQAEIRIDVRDIAYYDSVYETAQWWETECGYTSARVPEYARLPMNSLWYSYHQLLNPEDIVAECRLSKPLGMDTVLIDDGWQTEDNGRGYAFCGDWEVASAKIPDMKKLVDDIHDCGMKVILWYSVPLIGTKSKNFEKFKDMILDGTGNRSDYFALDPRYKQVREFLTGMYEQAVSEWGLDGLKLDFIDSFVLCGKSLEPDERRDFVSLEQAIDELMIGINKRLCKINPDIMLEFRQSYVGPAIKQYGNMLRVADCPNDSIVNRVETLRLRFTSGKTAVHSDMLMWNKSEPVEAAAMQLTNILFAVPQISVRLAELCSEHKKMLEFYLKFWREHREILLDGRLVANNPESNFSSARSTLSGKAVCVCYTDRVADIEGNDYFAVVNATAEQYLILKNASGKKYTVYNCMGECQISGTIASELCELEVPRAGIVIVKA